MWSIQILRNTQDPNRNIACCRFPYVVQLYDKPSLFAGKIHTVLCRAWKDRDKGRDLFDHVFYLSQKTTVNIKHLEARMKQTGFLPPEEVLDLQELRDIRQMRFSQINYRQAKQDVLPFITRPEKLDLWSKEFFTSITEELKKESAAAPPEE